MKTSIHRILGCTAPTTTTTTTPTPSRFYLIPSPLHAGSRGGVLYVCMYGINSVKSAGDGR